jgi:lysyl-tRNA synthetase class 2
MHQELSEQEQVRREALQEIINLGIDPFPAAEYTVTHTAEGIRDTFAEGMEMKDVSLAGRVMSKRIMGKASFAELQDSTGRIQLYFNRDEVCPGEDKTLYNEVFQEALGSR